MVMLSFHSDVGIMRHGQFWRWLELFRCENEERSKYCTYYGKLDGATALARRWEGFA